MISRVLSTSKKRAALHQVVPGLAEFCQQLYPLLVAHADDFGRLSGDSFTVKHGIDPTSPRPIEDFARALQALNDVGLITWYPAADRQFIQIEKFEPHQSGLHKRTSSVFPAPEASGKVPEPGVSRKFPVEEKRTEQNLTEGNRTKNVSSEPSGGSKPAAPRRSAQTGLALSPVVLEFPTIGADGDVYRLSEAQVAEWAKLFPGLDVLAECRHALAWVRENTGHRKTSGGMGRFLVGWFTRSVNRRGAGSGVSSRLDSNGLSQRSNDVLRGLGRRS